jgi:hypothetical protein
MYKILYYLANKDLFIDLFGLASSHGGMDGFDRCFQINPIRQDGLIDTFVEKPTATMYSPPGTILEKTS